MGHRRIAFIRFVQFSSKDVEQASKERQKSFKQAMAKAGLPVTRNGFSIPFRVTNLKAVPPERSSIFDLAFRPL